MSTLTRIAAGAFGLAATAASLFFVAFPRVAPPRDGAVERTPDRLARGEYLVEHVAACLDCHSTRDWSRYAGPITEGTRGMGGDRFGPEIGIPGTVHARNITPAGVGAWSDGELRRAITSGVSRDGSPLFPLMPYQSFAEMCDRDVDAVIAYVRTLAPVDNHVPAPDLDFPLNVLVATIPQPAAPRADCPDAKADSVAYGAYLVTMASCNDCHTNRETPDRALSGGIAFPLPTGGVVRSANLTPDVETGLGTWTRERFIARFKAMDNDESYPKVGPGAVNTIMPWQVYSGMTEEDLGAIYDYLRTVKPVANPVIKQSDAAVATR